MRRTALFFSTLLLGTGICLAQEQANPVHDQQDSNQQQKTQQADDSLRNPDLDNAPDAVKEAILRQARGQTLKELAVHKMNGAKIYEAIYESNNAETRLRLDENGDPVSMHIAGLGGEMINEAAGARRDDQPQQQQQAQPQTQQATATQQPSVPQDVRQRIEQQLGQEAALLEVQPKVFYQLNIRQDGNVQQIWADESGTVLREQQQ